MPALALMRAALAVDMEEQACALRYYAVMHGAGDVVDSGVQRALAGLAGERSDGPPPRPNCFLAFRIRHPVVWRAAEVMQQSIVARYPHLAQCVVPVRKLHITAGVMPLSSPRHVALAAAVLRECAELVDSHFHSASGAGPM